MKGVSVDLGNFTNQFQLNKKQSVFKWGGVLNNAKTPLFSIVMPIYNHPDSLDDALSSAINQVSFENYEIVIVDDNPDLEIEHLEVIKKFSPERIRYYCNVENMGLCANWNRATELARGAYLIMLHEDDVLSPYYLKTVSDFLEQHSDAGIIGVNNTNFRKELPDFGAACSRKFHKKTEMDFFFGRYIGIAGMMYSRQLAIDLGGFQENEFPNEDTIFIGKAIQKSVVYKLDSILAGSRIFENLSLKEGILDEEILLTYATRRALAQTNSQIDFIERNFDTELFYNYMYGAERHWNVKLYNAQLIANSGLKRTEPSRCRHGMLKVIDALQRCSYKLRTKQY